VIALAASIIGGAAFGATAPLPPDPFVGVKTYDEAKQLFEQFPRVRILFENGGGSDPGAPAPTFEADYATWPVPGITPTSWYFDANGALVSAAPAADAADSYVYDPSQMHDTTIPGGSQSAVWAKLPTYNWNAPKAGTALAYETAPLAQNTTVIGSSSVDLWLKSTAPDTDLQVSITEVRPDGRVTYVQSGWLRASNRALDSDATELRPTHPLTEAAVKQLESGKFELARVEVFPVAHVFRAGSRIRVIIDAPGGSRPAWSFDALPAAGNQVNTIGRGGAVASRIVLPIVQDVDVTAARPACPSLRGQPCRPKATITNNPGRLTPQRRGQIDSSHARAARGVRNRETSMWAYCGSRNLASYSGRLRAWVDQAHRIGCSGLNHSRGFSRFPFHNSRRVIALDTERRITCCITRGRE
jgi:hypothetical protein